MKNYLYGLLMVFGLSISLIGCGDKNNNNTPVNTCQAGYVNTNAGCLSTYGCQAGYVNYNGQCVNPSTVAVNNQCAAQGLVSTPQGCMQYAQCLQVYASNPAYCTSTGGGFNNGACQAGSVQTAIGCLPQYTCPAGYGYSANGSYCGNYSGGCCIPQSGMGTGSNCSVNAYGQPVCW